MGRKTKKKSRRIASARAQDSNLYTELKNAWQKNVSLELDDYFGLSSCADNLFGMSAAGYDANELEMHCMHAQWSAFYEKYCSQLKERAKKHNCEHLSILFHRKPVGVCPFFAEIVLTLISESTTIKTLIVGSFGARPRQVTREEMAFEMKLLEAIHANTNIPFEELTIDNLPYSPGSPLNFPFGSLKILALVHEHETNYPKEACAAFEEALSAGNCLERVSIRKGHSNYSIANASKPLCELLGRCMLHHFKNLQTLVFNWEYFPSLRNPSLKLMASLESYSISSGGNQVFDLSLQLPKKELDLGAGTIVRGTVPEFTTSTLRCIVLGSPVSKEAFLSLANLKSLDCVLLYYESRRPLSQEDVLQLLTASNSIQSVNSSFASTRQAQMLLRCNKQFTQYNKSKVPSYLLPRILPVLEPKPSLVYSILRTTWAESQVARELENTTGTSIGRLSANSVKHITGIRFGAFPTSTKNVKH